MKRLGNMIRHSQTLKRIAIKGYSYLEPVAIEHKGHNSCISLPSSTTITRFSMSHFPRLFIYRTDITTYTVYCKIIVQLAQPFEDTDMHSIYPIYILRL